MIGRLILATNENDLLTRFVNDGDYSVGEVTQTSSPSMDIQVASNFERYLFLLYEGDPERTRQAMDEFARTGRLEFSEDQRRKIKGDFCSRTVDEKETSDTITAFHQQGYLIDPHTAVGVKAAHEFIDSASTMVCLATAHPAKFGTAVMSSIGSEPDLPPALSALSEKDSRCEVLAADVETVRSYLADRAL